METKTLKRGNHVLPHQSQVTGRDLHGEQIQRNQGKRAMAFFLTDEQARQFRTPYSIIVKAPESAALAWTAFHTVSALMDFVKAYGLGIDGPVAPGETFYVVIPELTSFLPLQEVTWENPYAALASEVR